MLDDAEISFRIRRLEPFLRGRRAVDGQLGRLGSFIQRLRNER